MCEHSEEFLISSLVFIDFPKPMAGTRGDRTKCQPMGGIIA